MNYPLISEYVEAIRFAEDNFSTLTNLRPVMENGRPFMSSGNFAVVFKMEDIETGKLYAVKCFTREEEQRERCYRLISDELNGVNSPYLTSIKYLEKELFVDVSGSAENEFPVLLMDWVEGQTMDAYIRENINDKWELERLCRNFCRMGAWLLEQPFAHGDLKPENIMVSDGAMPLLVDYDGMYVPAMKGEVARELGSPDYRHPLRTEKDFDKHIDDFPLASIALSLKSISLDPSLLARFGASDRLLFSEIDYADLGKCDALREITSLYSDPDLINIHSMFLLSYSQKSTLSVLSQLIMPKKAEKQIDESELLSTEVTDEDLAEAWEDEYGVLYSKDRKRLLKYKNGTMTEYVVKEGTKVICDEAFHYSNLHSIKFPDSLVAIGKKVFCGSRNLTLIEIPKNLQFVENSFCYAQIINKSPYFKIEGNLLIQNRTVIGVDGNPESVTVPNYVTTIGRMAFCGCKSLTSIKLPDSLISIKERAFDRCENLTSIKLPGRLTSIENETFSQCINLSSIEFPDSLTSIGNEAFFHCKNLKKIKLPDSLTTIGDSAFEQCENLTSIKFPKNLISIGERAFYWCRNLTSVDLPYGLISIGDYAFVVCVNLASVELPDSLTFIGDSAFWGCENLKEIELPKKLQRIEGQPFNNIIQISNSSPFFKIENDLLIQNNKIIRVSGNPKHVKIPTYITSIGDYAFSGCKELNSVDLPNYLTSIGNYAFQGCKKLVSIELPPYGLTSIGDSAFSGCESLTDVKLPKNLTSIGNYTFAGCRNLTSIDLPDSLTLIENGAFSRCENLTKIELPKYLQYIKGNPFTHCNVKISSISPYFVIENDLLIQSKAMIFVIGNPKTITIPDYITHIGNSAFKGCGNLTSIKFPNNLTSIGDYAFHECNNLTSIKLPDRLSSIGNSAFGYCSNLTSIELPDSLTSIDYWAFGKCENLEKIYIVCAPNADKATVLEKFKRQLLKELHSKIELIDRR